MKKNAWIGIVAGVAAVVGIVVLVYLAATMPVRQPVNNAPINNAPALNEPAANQPSPIIGLPVNPATQIHVTSLQPNDVVTSPLTITGEARGTWFFEASFPVVLQDANGKVIAAKAATALGDWMTEDFVPFTVTLTFDKPATETGTLILEKDNPSDNPQFANQLTLPVRFTASKQTVKNGCVVSGCSGQICSDQQVITDCIYKPEYACYATATCEKQSNGQCGWTPSAELSSCIATAQK